MYFSKLIISQFGESSVRRDNIEDYVHYFFSVSSTVQSSWVIFIDQFLNPKTFMKMLDIIIKMVLIKLNYALWMAGSAIERQAFADDDLEYLFGGSWFFVSVTRVRYISVFVDIKAI